jgi:hypothetical protein
MELIKVLNHREYPRSWIRYCVELFVVSFVLIFLIGYFGSGYIQGRSLIESLLILQYNLKLLWQWLSSFVV